MKNPIGLKTLLGKYQIQEIEQRESLKKLKKKRLIHSGYFYFDHLRNSINLNKNADEILTSAVLSDMEDIANGYPGKNYDIYFEWSDEKIYCSELVWKIYKEATGIEIGNLKTLKDFDLSSNSVQSIMEERYGNDIPLDEDVISPAGMFNSEKLVLIEQK